MKPGLPISLGLLLFGAGFAQANCSSPHSPKIVLDCILSHHPELLRSKLEQRQATASIEAARQIPNPELEGRFGQSAEVALLHKWELGGKRTARVMRADSEVKQADAEIRKTEEKISMEALLALHRLRQIEEESETLAETTSTFQSQVALLGTRPALTPEQQISLSVFQLAREDAELKEATLLTEKDRLVRSLQLWMGSGAPYSREWLPKEPIEWPAQSTSEATSPASGILRKASAHLSLAEADLDLARAEAWPSLALGPFVERASDGASLGVQVSLSLPLFHWNSGGKAVARAGVEKAEAASRIARLEADAERTIAADQYRRAVDKLGKSRWHQEHQKRHEKLEHLFKRGLVSIPLVIEAHRQVLELQKTSHELEMKALEALYLTQILNGKLPEAFL